MREELCIIVCRKNEVKETASVGGVLGHLRSESCVSNFLAREEFALSENIFTLLPSLLRINVES
jgi:hypothetical protein